MIDWNHIGYRAWQCLTVLAAVVTLGVFERMFGLHP